MYNKNVPMICLSSWYDVITHRGLHWYLTIFPSFVNSKRPQSKINVWIIQLDIRILAEKQKWEWSKTNMGNAKGFYGYISAIFLLQIWIKINYTSIVFRFNSIQKKKGKCIKEFVEILAKCGERGKGCRVWCVEWGRADMTGKCESSKIIQLSQE